MTPVAIVGIGCRFPGGADSPVSFWQLLRDGVDAIADAPPDRLDLDRLYDPDPAKPGKMYMRRGGFVEGVDLFDASFFGISAREAVHIDPQHRFLLELTQEALDDAGIAADRVAGTRTGVFVGVSTHDYGDIQMWPQNRERIGAHSNSGAAGAIAANRVSYAFDLRGPSMVVDTACSSSITAAHLALRSLATGESELAIVAGAQVMLTPEISIGFCKASMISPDGECRAFDAAANGYVRAEGAGAVVLKPLEAARADGDRVYAVLLGSAVNEDGRTVGMTVPGVDTQRALLRDALAASGVTAREVQYVEAHGTGTPVGDPIEAAALGAVLAEGRADGESCLIGSAKTNIGHLEAAAGMAGLIKVALTLYHRELPPSLHFTQPNPAIDFDALRLRVVTELQPWPLDGGAPATAMVNSFGFGGANANLVVREAPAPLEQSAAAETPRPELVTLSARSEDALAATARSYLDLLAARPELSVRELAAATVRRRSHHDLRLGVVASSTEELVDTLDGFLAGERRAALAAGRKPSAGPPRLAFVFSGMGPQWWGMGRELAAQEPVFRETLERCDEALRPHAGWSLLEELGRDEASSRVGEADLAQVTNFAIQVAIAALWKQWGITPDAVIGHSAGEIAAAYVSGALDLEQATLLAYHRSRLQARATGKGRMLAAAISRAEAEELIAALDGVELAAVNAPGSVTLTGDAEPLAELERSLSERQVFARILPVVVPYHSRHMDAIERELVESLSSLRPAAEQVPMVSVVDGDWIAGAELGPGYWWRNIRQPVLFGDGVGRLLDDGYDLFLELGPHPVLAQSVRECLVARDAAGTVLPSIRRLEDEREAMLRSLGALYATGREIDWDGLQPHPVRHVDLPRYPWQRERHWFESAPVDTVAAADAGSNPLLARRVRGPRPVWESSLGGEALAWLDDHVIQHTVPFPGAGYVAMALGAARELLGAEAPAVRGVEFRRALFLGRRDRVVLQASVDPDTMRFQAHGGDLDGGEWTLNAQAALAAGEERSERVDLDELRQRCTLELSHEAVYEQISRRGLEYGPAFTGMDEVRRGDGEAFGRVRLARPLDLDGHEVHPALLDAAFQYLVVAAESREDARGFLPVGIDEVCLRRPPGESFFVHARLRAAKGEGFEGDIDLFDEDGEVLLTVRGLRASTLDDARDGGESVDDWLYEYRWEETGAGATAAHADETGWAAYYADVEPLLNDAAAGFAARALAPDVPDSPLARAMRAGARETDPEAALARLRAEHPEYELDAALLELCGSVLPAALRGERDLREQLFGPDALALLTRFYAEAPTALFYNALLADAVADAAPRRILEVGGGTGGTTTHVLGRIDRSADYVFTDVSAAFAAKAHDAFGDRIETATLDLERPAAEQGLSSESFDVVIAANVLHATADLRTSLAHLRALLAPGGTLVLLEITRPVFWLDLAFGLNDGWWRHADHELRPDGALLDASAWRELLTDSGFVDLEAIADSPADGRPGQTVLIARVPALVASEREPEETWLVLADGDGVAERLVGRLTRPAILVRRGEDLDEAATRGGVIDLRSLDACEDDAPLASAVSACAEVTSLLARLDAEHPPERGLALVTGAMLPQSALLGLGRVIVKERPELRCRMIEIANDPTDAELDALARELETPTAEEEVALRGGKRLVRRLHRLRLGDAVAAEDDRPVGPGEAFRARIRVPGALETIGFAPSERRAPAAGQVEIEVAAAGLNFRDVMLALGLLPQLALEETPGTDLFGLDGAGTIVAVGEGVEGISVGDDVVAIGYGAVGSHMTVKAELVAPKPRGLDWEEAAALPVAFVTAHAALLHLARLRAGERVLIHAGAGGVGHAAIQVALAHGAEVLATAGSSEKREHVRSLGVEHVFDSRTLEFADDVRRVTGGAGVDVVLNSLAGEAIERGIESLAPHGRFVEIGKRDVYDDHPLGLLAFRKNLSYFALDIDRMGAERPKLVGELLRDVMHLFREGTYRPPPIVRLPVARFEEAVRLMAQARHIGKITLTVAGEQVAVSASPLDRPIVHADGTYLITGGLGGFGAAVAEWLVSEGATSLVLVGRSEPDVETRARLAALPARVEIEQADVTDAAELRGVLERARPLRGILHAAMVLDDAPLAQLDEARFERAMAAKVAGAWNLHRLTHDDELDFLVFFSSIAGLLGNPLQANYAAANSFLDALAHRRRAEGLPALSVNWGVLSQVGFVSRHRELGPYLASQGYLSFTPAQALAALGAMLRLDLPQVMAARIDWRRLADSLPATAASPRVRHLVPELGVEAVKTESSAAHDLLAAPVAERPERVVEYLKARVARVLGVAPAKVEADRPLTEMGLDSLIAVELMTLLKNEVGLELAAVQLLEGVTVMRLAELVLERLPAAPASSTPVPATARTASAEPAPEPPPEPVATNGRPDYAALDYLRWSRGQRLARGALAAGFRAGANVQAEGLEHVPAVGGCLLATNHLSMADVPLMLTLLQRPAIVLATDELRTFPWLDWFLGDLGNAIWVDRGSGDVEPLEDALTVLASGGIVGVGPEGRLSRTGALERGRVGVAFLASRARVPVVPVAAWGQEQMGRSWRRLRRAPVIVRFGKALEPPEGNEPAELVGYTELVMAEIASLLPERYRGVYAK
jgi:1-acyl-sn-glycerol-3-phosphate acyltransferase